MERAEWLKRMRRLSEELYDCFSSSYWAEYGNYENATQVEYIGKLLGRLAGPGKMLSAACGAGRYDGFLLEAGHSVVGTDQSQGMLDKAREHFPESQFPQLRYEKVGLQEMDYDGEFDGAICMDALEHVCPEDWPGIMANFARALKPGGLLYFNPDFREEADLAAHYERSRAHGQPVVFGEVADEVEQLYTQIIAAAPEERKELAVDGCVYHYCPPAEQVREWLVQAGFENLEEGEGSEYRHMLARKKEDCAHP